MGACFGSNLRGSNRRPCGYRDAEVPCVHLEDTLPNLGMGELVVILLILLLIFGAGRLPQIGEGIGKAIKGLKRGLQTDDNIDVSPKSTVGKPALGADSTKLDEVHDAEVVDKKKT